MSVTILRPRTECDPVEAMRLRTSFTTAVGNGATGVIVDLTGVRELSGAGLAAVTHLVTQGARTGIAVRVLLPEQGSRAARIIEQADLARFLRPGGLWNPTPAGRNRTAAGCGVTIASRRAASLQRS
ncbi:STAS domain-containing protein [Mycobacterium sp. G7A2]|uniref:STAS domain-containing protein n=1 Tax=Mycobacterium sp. G7A2 TaxID=3317307 RepID=UPI0035A87680